jgi:Tfp pilus assembly protein PilO
MGGRVDRLWMLGGAVSAVLLVALGWFLLIDPTNDKTDGLRGETEVSEVQLISLQRRLQELQAEKAKLPQYEAELTRNKQALPADSGVPAFLRQLEDAGDAVNASVSNVNVGVPTQLQGGAVYALPITVTADGTATQLSPFLDQLQQTQPRAVLIETANLTATTDQGGSNTDRMNLTLTMKVFVAPTTTGATPAATPTN